MQQDIPKIPNMLALTIVFYGVFLLISLLLIYFFNIDWRPWFEVKPISLLTHLAIGGLAAFGVVKFEAWWGFGNTRLGADFAMLIKMIGNLSIPALLLVSACAGIFEELLFRGVLQPMAIENFGLMTGLFAVAVLFGVMHFVSFSYFTFTTFIGLILGMVYQQNQDLLSLMAVHASYDFVALYMGIYAYDLGADDSSM